MQARLVKEARDLLPVLASTLLLITVPCLIWPTDAGALAGIALGIGCAVLGGWVFGNEFQQRTLLLLLSQPIARSVLWRDKMLLLGAAILLTLGAAAACMVGLAPSHEEFGPLVLALMALCAFCGGPYWTLLLRNGIGGMVASAAMPSWILILTVLVAERITHDEQAGQIPAAVLIFIYCGVIYWLGYARFKRLQVADNISRELALPAGLEAALVSPLTRVSSRFQGVFASLLKKEFRLQQVSFLLAGLFVLIAVAGFGVWFGNSDVGGAIVGGDYVIYVLVLPLIAGAISLGEERGWGLAEWHLTLPPPVWKQWSAKMFATLLTSLVLGLALPAAMFVAGAALRGELRRDLPPEAAFPATCWVLGSMLVTSVAVYAGSISKTSLRAILAALAMLVGSGAVMAAAGECAKRIVISPGLGPPGPSANPGPVFFCVGLMTMLCVTQWLARSNFRRITLAPRRLLLQMIAFFAALWVVTLIFVLAVILPSGR